MCCVAYCPQDIARALQGVTEVYHCAAMIDTKTRHYVPAEMIAVNVGGTRTLLELAEEAGVERLVYTSTSVRFVLLCDRLSTELLSDFSLLDT